MVLFSLVSGGFRSWPGWALSGGGGLLAGKVVSPVCLCGGCGVLHEIRVLGVWSRPGLFWAGPHPFFF